MSLKKETEKIVLLQVKGLIQIFVKVRNEKKTSDIFIIHQSSFERDPKYCHWTPSIV